MDLDFRLSSSVCSSPYDVLVIGDPEQSLKMEDDEMMESIAMLKSRLSATVPESKKGEGGTILIIGGCRYYTGAPFFVAMGALHTGSELVYLFSEPEAVVPLKTLLPECIVCGIEYQEWILNRITTCVVGSGLGRPLESTCREITRILGYLDSRGVPIVVDGDGIRLHREFGVQGFQNVILTPNSNEQKYMGDIRDGFFYVQKGPRDVILKDRRRLVVDTEGCPKRVGGQGDILAGVIASLVSKCRHPLEKNDILASVVVGCRLVRSAGRLSYRRHWRTLITRDILEELRRCFKSEVGRECILSHGL